MKGWSQDLERIPRWYLGAIVVGAGMMCLALGRFCFPYFVFDPDTAAYLFQAKLFAQGMLAADAPPEFGFSPSPHINIYNGLWFAKYTFGNSLFLVPGVLLDIPWIMPALATGITLLVFFAIINELFDRRVASLAVALAALSPTTLIMGSTLLSQPTSRLSIAIFLWSLLRGLAQDQAKRATLYGAIAGFALGYGFNTRPLVAVVFGITSLILVSRAIAQARNLSRLVLPAAAATVALLVMIGLFFAWNAHLTGDPWLLPYHALQAGDRMGFGLRGEGYAPLIKDFRIDFTPAVALGRIWQHTLPCVLFNIVGWGNYVPNMLLFSEPARVFPAGAWFLLVPAGLIALALLHRSRSIADLLCASTFVVTLIALFFQYSDHSTWGSTPLHCSYYNEATLFGLIPLLARGMLIFYDTARRANRHFFYKATMAICALLFANTVYTNANFILLFREWDPYYQRLPQLVAAADLHNAVVFVPNSRNAPLGEYPFLPLDRADIVYFRTGPLPQWRLDTPDWRSAYQKYFFGRSAYRFDKLNLYRLDTPAGQTTN